MKYFVVRIGGVETPLLFPVSAKHKEIAEALERFGPVLAAGFVKIRGRCADDGSDDSLSVECHGESVGLHVGTRTVDESLIQMCLHLPE